MYKRIMLNEGAGVEAGFSEWYGKALKTVAEKLLQVVQEFSVT